MKKPASLDEEAFLRELAHAPERSPEAIKDPEHLGHFTILERLGRGGMGVVYRASDDRLGRVVALKVLPAEFEADRRRRARFLREARAAAVVSHPNIVTVYEIGEEEGRIYIAMELAQGDTLRKRLANGPLSIVEAVRVVRGIAEAVAVAHDSGIVHRDLKPENIILSPSGDVKVLDFGLAKIAGDRTTVASAHTVDGHILGTPGYMSPEQTEGHEVDARADVFAIGAIFYELVTGRRAFSGSSVMQVLIATNRDAPERASKFRSGVSPALERVLSRALAKDPAERYPTARQLLAELDGLEAGPSRVSRPWALAVAGVAVAVAFGAWLAGSAPHTGVPPSVVSPEAASRSRETSFVPSSRSKRACLFGGFRLGDPSYLHDEWQWDGATWSLVSTPDAPSARAMASAVALDGRMVLFGGHGDDDFLTDTWIRDQTGWSFQNAPGPAARGSASVSVLDGKVVLFGGLGKDGFSDTWVFDGYRWSSAYVRGPSVRWGAATATLKGKLVLFGGKMAGNAIERLADTWTWDGVGWQKLDVQGPPGRSYAAMTTLEDKVVLFGGGAANGVSLADTWEWDGSAWTQHDVPGPPGRHGASMTALGDRVVLFGGARDDGRADAYFADTWEWDGESRSWIRRDVSGPSARVYATFAGPM